MFIFDNFILNYNLLEILFLQFIINTGITGTWFSQVQNFLRYIIFSGTVVERIRLLVFHILLHCTYTHRRLGLTAGLASLQAWLHCRLCLPAGLASLQAWPHCRLGLTASFVSLQAWPHCRLILTAGLVSLHAWPHCRLGLTAGMASLQASSPCRLGLTAGLAAAPACMVPHCFSQGWALLSFPFKPFRSFLF